MGSAERRSEPRLQVDVQLQLFIPDAGPGRRLQAQLVDVGASGHGAGLRVPLRSAIQLGARISLLMPHVEAIRGIVVSRMGTSRYDRLGIRIEDGSLALFHEVARTLPPRAP